MNKYFMCRKPSRFKAGSDTGITLDSQDLIMCRVGEHPGHPKAPFPMCFTKEAFATLIGSVGLRPPESGSMGFSPADFMGFDVVEFSASGSANSGGAVYRPDSKWGFARCQHHQDQPPSAMRLWSGDLHSHPGSFGHPSAKSGRAMGDLGYVEEVFEMTEWMEWFFIPILTGTGTDDITIHPWVCRRGRFGTSVKLMIADLSVCEVSRFPKRKFNPHWEEACEREAQERARREAEADKSKEAQIHEKKVISATVTSAQPDSSRTCEHTPNKTYSRAGIAAKQASSRKIENDSAVTDTVRISIAAQQQRDRHPVGQYNYGDGKCGYPIPESVKTDMEYQAAEENLAHGTQEAPLPACLMTDFTGLKENDRHLADYIKRLEGIVSPAFRNKTILVVGVGAGSYAVEKIARLCPKAIRICDFDVVETPNLTRTAYTMEDALARRPKVEALALRCGQINPWVQIRPYSNNFTRISPFQMDEMFEGVDLVVGGTDSLEAQALVNEESVKRGIPAVFIGIHAGAQGGRVIWSIPGETSCYRCVARDRFEAAAAGGDDTANLSAATGSIFDCQFIDMLATKIAVAILERGQDSAMGRFFEKMGARNDIVIRCDPDYEWGKALWDAVLGDLPTSPKDFARELKEEVFLAMDSLWLKSARDPHCPVCGSSQEEVGEKKGNHHET